MQLSAFNNTPPTVNHPLSLHDALPIWLSGIDGSGSRAAWILFEGPYGGGALCSLILNDVVGITDRKSTRLNSSHPSISYAVFCLKKKLVSNSHSHPLHPSARNTTRTEA